jgi:hypothetical protein
MKQLYSDRAGVMSRPCGHEKGDQEGRSAEEHVDNLERNV